MLSLRSSAGVTGSRGALRCSIQDDVPKVAPFDGLLFDPAVVGDIGTATAPPYDVILADELARFRRGSPYSITHVDLTEGDAAADRPDQYTRAGGMFRRWREEGALRPAGGPAFYPYEMAFSYRGVERRIRGVILEVELERAQQWLAGQKSYGCGNGLQMSHTMNHVLRLAGGTHPDMSGKAPLTE
jgi:hypothetical protein